MLGKCSPLESTPIVQYDGGGSFGSKNNDVLHPPDAGLQEVLEMVAKQLVTIV